MPTCHDLLCDARLFLVDHPGLLTLLVCFAYFVLMLAVRRRLVWRIDHHELRAQGRKLRAEIEAFPDPQRQSRHLVSARQLIDGALKDLDEGEKADLLGKIFDSGAAQLQCWDSLHEAKRLMAKALTPEQLIVRLIAAASELRTEVKGDWEAEAAALATKIDETLQKAANLGDKPWRVILRDDDHVVALVAGVAHDEETARALLDRALRVLYSVECRADLRTTDWHNKILWLTTVSLALVVLIAATFGHPSLLLMGALGGLLSKSARLRSLQDVPSDYDSRWSTFFFVAPLGALIGWSGLVLVEALKGYGLLGDAFANVSASGNPALLAQASAFLLGFSATLFDGLIARASAKEKPREPSCDAKSTTTASKPSGAVQKPVRQDDEIAPRGPKKRPAHGHLRTSHRALFYKNRLPRSKAG